MYLEAGIFDSPLDPDRGRDTIIHEIAHQMQYAEGGEDVFNALKEESKINLIIPNYTYRYNLAGKDSLSDLDYYEAQAQLVGNFGNFYYNERIKDGNSVPSGDLRTMANILKNSEFTSPAISWATRE